MPMLAALWFVSPCEVNASSNLMALASHHNSMRPRKIGVVGVIVREARLLVIQRSATVRAPLKFCFPGGTLEVGESEEQTLVRELSEELGIIAAPHTRLHSSITPWNVDLRWWQAEVPETVEIRPNPAEVAAIHWCTVPEILALADLLESNRIFLAAWKNAEFEIRGLNREPT